MMPDRAVSLGAGPVLRTAGVVLLSALVPLAVVAVLLLVGTLAYDPRAWRRWREARRVARMSEGPAAFARTLKEERARRGL